MNKMIRPVFDTLAASVFCGFFSVVVSLVIQWQYLDYGQVFTNVQYILYNFISSTLNVFIPLLIFKFVKIKLAQKKGTHVRT